MSRFHRGEVWRIDLGYLGKVRPGVIVSIPATDQDRAIVTLVPHTTSTRGSRFEVRVTHPAFRVGAFDAQNLVTIPHAKMVRKLGDLTADEFAEVEDAVRSWLGL